MSSRVQLVFYGEVIRGFRPSDVRDDLGDLLDISESSRAALFSGARIVLKQSMDFFEAQGYEERLRDLGALVHIEPDDFEITANPMAAAESGAATSGAATAPTPQRIAAPRPAGTATLTPVPPPSRAPAPPAAVAAPAALAPPEEQVTCPNCGERQSKRAVCRRCGSDIETALRHKHELEGAQRAQRLAAARARHGLAPLDDSALDAPSALGIGFSGRLGRLPYLTALALAIMGVNLLLVFAIPHPSAFRLYALIFGSMLLAVYMIRLAVLRAHDFNGSGLWAALLLVPYLGPAIALALAVLPGTSGDNEHGGQPRRGNPLFAAVAVLLMAAMLVATYRWIATMVDEVMPTGAAVVKMPEESQLLGKLGTAQAVDEFRDRYMPALPHKAFAAAPGGVWGWRAGAASSESAAADALDRCDAKRDSYSRPCELISVNELWVSR